MHVGVRRSPASASGQWPITVMVLAIIVIMTPESSHRIRLLAARPPPTIYKIILGPTRYWFGHKCRRHINSNFECHTTRIMCIMLRTPATDLGYTRYALEVWFIASRECDRPINVVEPGLIGIISVDGELSLQRARKPLLRDITPFDMEIYYKARTDKNG